MRSDDVARYLALPHRVDLYFSAEDEAWICRFPELPGCIADGETPEAALRAGRAMKELWLRTALQHNDPIPQPEPEPEYSGKLVLRLPKRLHERAARMAALEGVSLNAYLLHGITEAVERSGAKNLLRYIAGQLDKVLSRSGAPALFLSLFVQPIYGDKDDPVALDEMAPMPSVLLQNPNAS